MIIIIDYKIKRWFQVFGNVKDLDRVDDGIVDEFNVAALWGGTVCRFLEFNKCKIVFGRFRDKHTRREESDLWANVRPVTADIWQRFSRLNQSYALKFRIY